MSEIALIWAQAQDAAGRGVIGANGGIPWHVPEDFARFKQINSQHPVVMGERTWLSLPKKPLPNRTNIILSDTLKLDTTPPSNSDAEVNLPKVAASLTEALDIAAAAPGGELIWIIGGESVYRQTIGLAKRIAVTEIDLVVDGDTYAPEISNQVFQKVGGAAGWQSSQNGLHYRFVDYWRR